MDAQGLNAQTPSQPSGQPGTPSGDPAGGGGSSAQRPTWARDEHWDAETGTLKLDEFGQHYTELTAAADFKKQYDEKLAALPQKPEDVKFALPEGVKLPDGFALDENHPLLAKAREAVVTDKIDPAHANRFYQMFVEHEAAQATAMRDALGKEKAKLGANVETRIDALDKALRAHIGADKTLALIGDVQNNKSKLFTAPQVEAIEALVTKITTQGAHTPDGGAHKTEKKEVPWEQRMWPKRYSNAKAG